MASVSLSKAVKNDHATGTPKADSVVKKAKMESDRPQVPDRPPVAAKPRLKIAPPPPPKPFVTAASSSSSSPQSSTCNLHNSLSNETHTTQNGLINKFSTPTSKCNNNAASKRSESAEALSSWSDKPTSPKSPNPPPLPSSPPPTTRRGPLSPSTSFSLPASFRNKTINKAEMSTSLTFTSLTPILASTPGSPSPFSPKSPIRHVSPPRKTPPLIRPKPKHPSPPITSKTSDHHAPTTVAADKKEVTEAKQGGKVPCNDAPASQKSSNSATTPEHKLINSDAPKVPPLSRSPSSPTRPLVSPPQRPTSPPSRPANPPTKTPPARPTPPSARPSTLTKPSVSPSSVASPNGAPGSDTKSQCERKAVAPPPLPKNPPRGGIPRKPRSTSVKKTPTSETKPIVAEDQNTPTTPVLTSDSTDANKSSGETSQTNKVKSDSERLITEKDASNKVGQKENSTEAKLIENKTSGNQSAASAPKTAPKPRPRTRLSLPPPPDPVQQSQDQTSPTTSDGKKSPGAPGSNSGKKIQSSDVRGAQNVSRNESGGHQKELEYVEVYRGDFESSSAAGESKQKQRTDNSPKSKPSSSKDSQLGKSVDKSNAISGKLSTSRLKDLKPAGDNTGEQNKLAEAAKSESSRSSFSSDGKELTEEEPEATCGMLKEIEELLKTKLGDLELDSDTRDTDHSFGHTTHTENSEQHSASDRKAERSDSLCSTASRDSPSSSPVRPPRPKRQASISKISIDGVESLTSSRSSSTECLATGSAGASSKKFAPPKPKRTSVPRVNRSHSDVTGMRAIADSTEDKSEELHKQQEEGKPFLPPRLESLKRSDSSSSNFNQSPPPLPPRNKPRSASLKELGRAESEPSTETTPLPDLPGSGDSTDQTDQEMAEKLNTPSTPHSKVAPQHGQSQSSGATSPTKRPVKPRPARKAPPPPPGAKRSATFSPGDKLQSESSSGQDGSSTDSHHTPSSPTSPTVKKSQSMLHKRPKAEEEDHYHEISDGARAKEEVSSQGREETPPPALPPRRVRSGSLDDRSTSSERDTPEPAEKGSGKSTALTHKHSFCEDPKLREKRAKSALIQKVAQSLGIGKSSKKNKPAEIVIIVEPDAAVQSNTGKAKNDSEKSSQAPSIVINPMADIADGGETCAAASSDVSQPSQQAVAAAEVSGTSKPHSDRPLSTVSMHSSSSDQEGELQVFGSQVIDESVSSGSDTEPEATEEYKEEIYARRKAKKVFFIAKEIMTSEKTFVDVLKLLNLDFRVHISKATEKAGSSVIPNETLNKILDYLPQLQNFNEDLLGDLTKRIEKWDENPRLGDIFVKKGPFLKLYSSYIRNFENATAALEDATKKHPAFATALKEFEMSPRCAKLALKHYMLKPIQRIPQYRLLLQDYMKHLTEESPDYKATVTALNIVSEVADHANDSMRHGDNVQKLLEIQRSLIGQFEVIQPGRVLIKQGELQKLSRKEMQPRMFFLFNDVLLYTTPSTGGFKIHNILPLTGMKIVSQTREDYKSEFNIISVQRSFTLSASSSEEKEAWISALQGAIDENAKRHHTFVTVKHGPQTSLLDKDFVLGHKAPLWIPDDRVTMCMLCLVEFTLTWRRHHCRSCGRIICSQCSDNKAPLRYLKYKPARVCDECFDKLKEDIEQGKRTKSFVGEEESSTSVSEGATDDVADGEQREEVGATSPETSGLSLDALLARFQKIRISNREKRKQNNLRPSVLKEVHANDEGSDMSGYLRTFKSRKWKRLWFVVKGKVLYTYKASEDMAAIESMPLVGYEVNRMTTWFEGAEPDLLFEIKHHNTQPLTNRKDSNPKSPSATDKTTHIFRTDSAAATTKWVTVLQEASVT